MRHAPLRLGAALVAGAFLILMPAPQAAAELKVGVSGYIKLDIQYGDKNTGSFPSSAPGDTPLDGDKERDNDQTIIDARQSRLRATISDDVGGVKMSGRIEADFFSGDGTALSSNSRHFRLRHAFIRGDHPSGFFLLAGQTWSLIMNSDVAQPDLVDFNGPAGQIFSRQPQLIAGYRLPVAGGDLILAGNVEKHSVPDLGSTTVNEAQGSGQDVPLFTGKVSWLGKMVQVEAGFAASESRVTLVGGQRASETAWMGQVSGQVNVGQVSVFAHYHHSDGLSRLASGDFPTAFLVGADLGNVESDGWFAGVSYRLSKNTSLNGVFGWAKADEIAGAFTGDSLEKHQSIHANIIHKFWERWQVGLEYKRFDVEGFSGREGDVNIVNGAVWYFF
ncbi:MAG: porin [Candidatus Rokubacteria bacterium]|nr:porin [Candidatus Rokubacteria bacterium]